MAAAGAGGQDDAGREVRAYALRHRGTLEGVPPPQRLHTDEQGGRWWGRDGAGRSGHVPCSSAEGPSLHSVACGLSPKHCQLGTATIQAMHVQLYAFATANIGKAVR